MAEKRTIKRYTNRKLYDKLESRYVTLEEIARLVRGGEDVKVIDNETEEDLTAVTFAQIILDEEKRKTNLISVPFLRKIIRSGEARVQDISDRASRGIGAIGDLTEKAGERVREVVGGKGVEEGRSFMAELLDLPQRRIESLQKLAHESIGKFRSNPSVKREVERVVRSLETLEEAVSRLADDERDQDVSARSAVAASSSTRPNGASSGETGGSASETVPGSSESKSDDESTVGKSGA
jgi:polyhydroxyalkanoate synthesis repressor PhaR